MGDSENPRGDVRIKHQPGLLSGTVGVLWTLSVSQNVPMDQDWTLVIIFGTCRRLVPVWGVPGVDVVIYADVCCIVMET